MKEFKGRFSECTKLYPITLFLGAPFPELLKSGGRIKAAISAKVAE
jgi:hypothetical protein